ncbi:MAG TPA: hypothetical protein VJ302_22855 [Blastocatellia bacterium]|nr:hypothetical protein [Blastocatellia bacterium]
MNPNLNQSMPSLSSLPASLPHKGALEIELEQGTLIFRVSSTVQDQIETWLEKERHSQLTPDEARESRRDEELDDYLSLLNRLTRNLTQEISTSG